MTMHRLHLTWFCIARARNMIMHCAHLTSLCIARAWHDYASCAHLTWLCTARLRATVSYAHLIWYVSRAHLTWLCMAHTLGIIIDRTRSRAHLKWSCVARTLNLNMYRASRVLEIIIQRLHFYDLIQRVHLTRLYVVRAHFHGLVFYAH